MENPYRELGTAELMAATNGRPPSSARRPAVRSGRAPLAEKESRRPLEPARGGGGRAVPYALPAGGRRCVGYTLVLLM
jgi:hypothetical protein